MKHLPDSVTILGKVWRIRAVSRRTMPTSHGECDTDKRLIRLRSDQSPDDQWQHYFHELIHAALHEAFTQGPITVDLGAYEEPIVQAFETALYPAIRESGFGGPVDT